MCSEPGAIGPNSSLSVPRFHVLSARRPVEAFFVEEDLFSMPEDTARFSLGPQAIRVISIITRSFSRNMLVLMPTNTTFRGVLMRQKAVTAPLWPS